MFYFSKEKGMTFIETLVVIGIFSFLLVAIYSAVLYFYRTNSILIEQSYAVESARKGTEKMARDIREAVYSEEGMYPIESILPNEMIFYSDIDRDESVERIRYYIHNFLLKREKINPSDTGEVYQYEDREVSIMSENVRNIGDGIELFTYYDENGEEIEQSDFNKITDVVFVEINLVVNADHSRKPGDFTLKASASLRNIK